MTTILIIDDDATLRRFLSDYFKQEGLTTLSAANGPEGLRMAYQQHPDLVLLDVMMPGMDGWEVCARLREMSDVPIIFLTAKNTEADKLRGFRLGVDDFVTKPFSFAELGARIQAVLHRVQARGAPPGVVTCGDLTIDLARREVRRGEQPLALTPTEYRLLEMLARHIGEAVAETDLIQEVWGSYRQEDTTAVRRYVWLLRQKIEDDPAQPRYLHTVRGYGYRLESL
ncbi:MAG: response regulator transcription factor [Longilinea sp.]|mgnify:FL=1|nr:response regulator transcription factor [Longilinea sp.]